MDKEEYQEHNDQHHVSPLHHSQSNHTTSKNYSPSSWDLYFDQLYYLEDGTSVFKSGNHGIIFFCIHEAGHSALSFATLARQVRNFGTLIAFDLKGHGHSKKQDNNEDLSIETLCSDTIKTLKQILNKYAEQNVIIVGHSLGGSIAIRITDQLTNVEKNDRVLGLVAIDVVEGTAIQGIPFMSQIITDRPKHFQSLQAAIKWSQNSCTLRKLQSAKVSIPSQLVQYQKNGQKRFGWKINLGRTQKYWMEWYKGLSHIFLNIHISKILLVSEKERLDKELTIAQMQGKFKVVTIHNVGHSVMEDDNRATAKQLHQFIKDFRIPMTLSEKAEKELVGIAHFHPNLAKY